MQLFLCRHGETNHKVEGRIQGRSDTAELTAHGRDAAAALTAFIAYRNIDTKRGCSRRKIRKGSSDRPLVARWRGGSHLPGALPSTVEFEPLITDGRQH